MSSEGFPKWSMVPFPALVLAIAVLPIVLPRMWERRSFQIFVVGLCAIPVVVLFLTTARTHDLSEATTSYLSFVATLGALYITSGGVHLSGDIEAKPSTNVALLLVGSVLASVVGTTGASMLLIRPLLRTNRQRENRAHLVPFFILAVANAGGLLTPLGDPPLLVGYIGGVPFFWTLRLLPAWLLYVGSAAIALYVADRRAYAREPAAALARDRAEIEPLAITGRRNVALMVAIVPAAMLPLGFREAAMVAIAVASLVVTPRGVHEANGFTFAPIIDVALIFAGLFASLGPIEAALASVRALPAGPEGLAAVLGVRPALVGPRQRAHVHGVRRARQGAEHRRRQPRRRGHADEARRGEHRERGHGRDHVHRQRSQPDDQGHCRARAIPDAELLSIRGLRVRDDAAGSPDHDARLRPPRSLRRARGGGSISRRARSRRARERAQC